MARDVQPTPFGVLLRQCRRNVGLSQEALAERAGLSLRGISDLERGLRRAPHKHTLLQLADALDLNIAERRALSAAARQSASGGHTSAREHLALARLPESLTSFVGREQDIRELRRLLERCRLLTLHGPGGIGKTRLALEAARALAPEFQDGVALVALAAITDPGLVPATVAAAVFAPELDLSPAESLVTDLSSRQLLLILDNCEHLVDACAHLAERLLQACPAIKIVATSRETLNIDGELVWDVPLLDVPHAGEERPEDLAGYGAIRLFVERATLAQPGFSLDWTNAKPVAEICRQLDGVPLAIELAAARVRILAPAQIASRLHNRFALLVGISRTAESRHRTLSGTLDWSHDLLSESEKRAFARASVFAGGWSLEAAEAVLCGDAIDRDQVVELLARLVDKSLVVVDRASPSGARYRFLDTLRLYAFERLKALGDVERSERKHASFFLALAERTPVQLRGPNRRQWLAIIDREQDNLRAALGWLLREGDAESTQRLAGALASFWEQRGYVGEGLMWLSQSLDMRGSTPRARATALIGAAHLAHYGGRSRDVERAYCEESLSLWRQAEDDRGIAESLRALGNVLLLAGGRELDRAQALFEESMTLCRLLGDGPGVAENLSDLANLAWARGENAQAAALFDECLVVARQKADTWRAAYALHALGHLAVSAGDYQRGLLSLRESLQLSVQSGDRRGMSVCLQSLALLWHRRGAAEYSARLFGAAAAFRRSIGQGPWGRPWLQLSDGVRAVKVQLGQQMFDATWAVGESLALDDAVSQAMIDPVGPEHVVCSERFPRTAPVTPREWEVACLVSEGLTNRGIGERLVIAEGTAALHVRHILNKLGFDSRSQIAAWVSRLQRTNI